MASHVHTHWKRLLKEPAGLTTRTRLVEDGGMEWGWVGDSGPDAWSLGNELVLGGGGTASYFRQCQARGTAF